MLNTAPEPKLGSFSKHNMFDLSGKVALVTGGSRGIGRAAVMALAERGAHVLVNYVSNEGAARETVAAVESAGGKAEARSCSRRRFFKKENIEVSPRASTPTTPRE